MVYCSWGARPGVTDPPQADYNRSLLTHLRPAVAGLRRGKLITNHSGIRDWASAAESDVLSALEHSLAWALAVE